MLRRSALIILCPLTPELLSSLILLRDPEFIPSYGILSHKIFTNTKIKSGKMLVDSYIAIIV